MTTNHRKVLSGHVCNEDCGPCLDNLIAVCGDRDALATRLAAAEDALRGLIDAFDDGTFSPRYWRMAWGKARAYFAEKDSPEALPGERPGAGREQLGLETAPALSAGSDGTVASRTPAASVETTTMWTCPECAFSFDACHNDEGGGYSCPLCGEARAEARVEALERSLYITLGNGHRSHCVCVNCEDARAILSAGGEAKQPMPATPCIYCGDRHQYGVACPEYVATAKAGGETRHRSSIAIIEETGRKLNESAEMRKRLSAKYGLDAPPSAVCETCKGHNPPLLVPCLVCHGTGKAEVKR